MQKEIIEARIQRAIRPALDRADALLDYYTDGLPPEAWEPLALRVSIQETRRSFQSVGMSLTGLGSVARASVAALSSYGRVMSQLGDRPTERNFHGPSPLLHL